jgi:hypothetical protein
MKQLLLALTLLWTVSQIAAQGECALPNAEALAALQAACDSAETGTVCTPDGTGAPIPNDLSVPANGLLQLGTLTVIPLGGATLTELAYAGAAAVTLNATNRAGYTVIIRSAPDIEAEQVGGFGYADAATVDARTADGGWLRITKADGTVAWVLAQFVRVEGDIMSLPVGESSSGSGLATIGFESLPCGDGFSGLLLAAGEQPSNIKLGEIGLQIAAGGRVLVNNPTALQVIVLDGDAALDIGGQPVNLGRGQIFTLLDDGDAVVRAVDPEALLATFGLDLPPLPIAEVTPIAPTAVVAVVPAVTLPAATPIPPVAPAVTVAPAEAVVVSGSDPVAVLSSYLQARVVSDGARMQTLSCSAWRPQATIQAQSFRAMNASLDNPLCGIVSQDGSSAVVACNGVILTNYGGAQREWGIGAYQLVVEGGGWKVCGES